MTKQEAQIQAIELAESKAYSTAIICKIDGEWIPAAHFEGRYLTSYSPMSKAEEMETANVYNNPFGWKMSPVGQGAHLKDLLDSLG